MRSIEIDEDIYSHIAINTSEIGEPASSILRRLLGLDRKQTKIKSEGQISHELAKIMNKPDFQMLRSAVDRLLFILSVAYVDKKPIFERMLAIQGRGRRYFAMSRKEIEDSGNSTQPRNIPNSPYWVMTNTPTHQKKQMLRRALELLEYSDAAINAAVFSMK